MNPAPVLKRNIKIYLIFNIIRESHQMCSQNMLKVPFLHEKIIFCEKESIIKNNWFNNKQ